VATPGRIPVDRPLSADEIALLTWLLEHGEPRASGALSQLSRARVIARCNCGCASVDFSVDGVTPMPRSGLEVVSDYWWRTERGNLCGAFAFLIADRLAGLEVWSIDGHETPSELPNPEQLRPYSQHFDA
jgi:hypothetical protein